MKCKASYNSRAGAGEKLRTVGVLIMSPKGLLYKCATGMESLERVFQYQLDAASHGMEPSAVFQYHVGSGNGISNEWSQPFSVEGETPEAIAANLLDGLKAR